jgi:hypothetical protein
MPSHNYDGTRYLQPLSFAAYADKAAALEGKRERSPYFQSLNDH